MITFAVQQIPKLTAFHRHVIDGPHRSDEPHSSASGMEATGSVLYTDADWRKPVR